MGLQCESQCEWEFPFGFGTSLDQIRSFAHMGKWDVWRTGSGNRMPEQGSSDYDQIQGSETQFVFFRWNNSVERLPSCYCCLKLFIQLEAQGILF